MKCSLVPLRRSYDVAIRRRCVPAPYSLRGRRRRPPPISYKLDTERLGTLHDFPAELEATAIGSVVEGVSFDATRSDGSTFTGPVYVNRGL